MWDLSCEPGDPGYRDWVRALGPELLRFERELRIAQTWGLLDLVASRDTYAVLIYYGDSAIAQLDFDACTTEPRAAGWSLFLEYPSGEVELHPMPWSAATDPLISLAVIDCQYVERYGLEIADNPIIRALERQAHAQSIRRAHTWARDFIAALIADHIVHGLALPVAIPPAPRR